MNAITMTKKGNARLDGVKYKAVPEQERATCTGCAFAKLSCSGARCTSTERAPYPEYKVQTTVIFVRKHSGDE